MGIVLFLLCSILSIQAIEFHNQTDARIACFMHPGLEAKEESPAKEHLLIQPREERAYELIGYRNNQWTIFCSAPLDDLDVSEIRLTVSNGTAIQISRQNNQLILRQVPSKGLPLPSQRYKAERKKQAPPSKAPPVPPVPRALRPEGERKMISPQELKAQIEQIKKRKEEEGPIEEQRAKARQSALNKITLQEKERVKEWSYNALQSEIERVTGLIGIQEFQKRMMQSKPGSSAQDLDKTNNEIDILNAKLLGLRQTMKENYPRPPSEKWE